MNIPENITLDELYDLIQNLQEKELEIKFGTWQTATLQKMPKEKYVELKKRIAEINRFSKEIVIPKTFVASCMIYDQNKELHLDVSMYNDPKSTDDLLIRNSEEYKIIQKDLQNKLDEIKLECTNLGVNPVVFVTKVLDEISRDEENIKDIIE